jgi:hypothetical protein
VVTLSTRGDLARRQPVRAGAANQSAFDTIFGCSGSVSYGGDMI